MPVYKAFGLTLSADRPIPGLVAPHHTFSPADTHVWFDTAPDSRVHRLPHAHWFTAAETDSGVSALRVWRLGDDEYFKLRYADGTEFIVSGSGRQVWATWAPPLTLSDTATYLLGPVCGFVLRRRGVTCMHASGIAVDGRAILFAGPACAGKSTTAATFARRGYRVLSDDVLALSEMDGELLAVPAYPQLRLWPESVALLFGTPDALQPLTPTWDKCGFDLTDVDGFHDQPLPIAAIYLLEERVVDDEPRISPISGREALLALVGNGYVSYLMDRSQQAREFDVLSRLVAQVPVRRLSIPIGADPARLCQAIISDSVGRRCTPLLTTAR